MSSIRSINRELRYFDRNLYAEKRMDSKVSVYRKSTYWVQHDLHDGSTLLYSRSYPHYVLSLTRNWSQHGEPVEWGLEPLLARLREIDNHNHDVLARIYEENEKRETLRKQAKSNDLKSMAYDLRRDFAKSVNDINTSTLEKVESRRKKENAYCK